MNMAQIKEYIKTGECVKLDRLYATGCKLEKIDWLYHFTGVERVDFQNNRIEKIEGVENLENIMCFYLEDNLITEIPNLSHLKKLVVLALNNNNIDTIKNVEHLGSIVFLRLNGNPIKYITEKSIKFIKKNDLYVDLDDGVDINNLTIVGDEL